VANQAAELSYAVRPAILLRYFGQCCLLIAVLTLVPLAVSLSFGETQFSGRYAVIAGGMTGLFILLSRVRAAGQVQSNEAMVLVAGLFLLIPAAMAYPLAAWGLTFQDALFEAVSGVTTTGLSTVGAVENAPRTFLFARAWMQWYGGLGIVILSLALIVRPGVAAKSLAITEVREDDLVGGTKAHARRVFTVYCILTAAAISVLWIIGAKPYNAVLYALSAVSTGGFSPHNNGLAGLGNWPIQAAVILFAVSGAIPLAFYHRPGRKPKPDIGRIQLQALLAVGLITALLLCLRLRVTGYPWQELLRQAPLLAFSAQSTAGFSTLEISRLDAGSKLILIISMAIGGGIGSTAGGFKILRLLIAVQVLRVMIRRASLSQHAFAAPRLGNQRLEETEIHEALLVILLFLGVIALSCLPFVAMGYPGLDSLFEIVSAIGTVGLSAGITSQELPGILKGVICFDMLLGRLEIVAWLVFINRKTWVGRRMSQS
jgi:trk system potassium uptake protein TrkH